MSFGKSLKGKLGYVIPPMQLGEEPDPDMPEKLQITFTGTTRKSGGWQLVKVE